MVRLFGCNLGGFEFGFGVSSFLLQPFFFFFCVHLTKERNVKVQTCSGMPSPSSLQGEALTIERGKGGGGGVAELGGKKSGVAVLGEMGNVHAKRYAESLSTTK